MEVLDKKQEMKSSEVEITVGVEIYTDIFSDMPAFDLFRHVGADAVDEGDAVVANFYVQGSGCLINEMWGLHEIRTCGEDAEVSCIKRVKKFESFFGTPDIFVGRFFDRTDVCF